MPQFRACLAVVGLVVSILSAPARAESPNLAPGFSSMPKGAVVVLMQPDVELFTISAGGVAEPKADWTEEAVKHLRMGIEKHSRDLGLLTLPLAEADADEFAEVSALYAAVARAISLHHMGVESARLPTKGGKLDWSLGEAVQPLQRKTGADYALFIWMRDSYASAERKVAIVALAALGVGLPAGRQRGYASLVDLRSGQVLWFNQLVRGTGDLREAEPAAETVAVLFENFPNSR